MGRERGICVVGGDGVPFVRGVDIREEIWVVVVTNCIVCEYDFLCPNASTIRTKVTGCRFFHIVSGSAFAKVGSRWRILIMGASLKNKSPNRRLPFNAELLDYGREKLRIDTSRGYLDFNRAWAAMLIGFMFLLRASELGALEFRDVASAGLLRASDLGALEFRDVASVGK